MQQIIEPDSRMGLAYERSVGFEKEAHSHDRLMIVCPRGACRTEVRVERKAFSIDSSWILMVPKGLEHSNHGLSAVYDTMALFPDESYVDQLIEENGLSSPEKNALTRDCARLKRTRWLDDLLNRYFFERILNAKSPLGCTYFLEKQALNEIARIRFSDKFLKYGEQVGEPTDDIAVRALQFIEANLFEALELSTIAKAARTSPSTLLRLFRREFRQTPYAYLRNRRLDEAAGLLGRGDYRVADVAVLVGYEDLSAFSKAFKHRFRTPPVAYRAV